MDKMLIFHVFAALQMCCQNQNFVNTLPYIVKWVKHEGTQVTSTVSTVSRLSSFPCGQKRRVNPLSPKKFCVISTYLPL